MIICECDPKNSDYDTRQDHCITCGKCKGNKLLMWRNTDGKEKLLKACSRQCQDIFDNGMLFPCMSQAMLTEFNTDENFIEF